MARPTLNGRTGPEHGVRVGVDRDQRGGGRLQLHQRRECRRGLALGQRLEQLPEANDRQQRARRLEEELAAARAAHAHAAAAAAAVGNDGGRALQRLQNDRDEPVSGTSSGKHNIIKRGKHKISLRFTCKQYQN